VPHTAAIKVSLASPAHVCFVPLSLRPSLGLDPTPCHLDDVPTGVVDDGVDAGMTTFPAASPLLVDSIPGFPSCKWFRVHWDVRAGLLHDQLHIFYQDKPFRKRATKSGVDVLVRV
jgi:hypothetical protein